MNQRQKFFCGDLSAPRSLVDKGRCCGRKPLVYKREGHRFCHRCDRSYHRYQDFQIDNWAWKFRSEIAQFEYVTGRSRIGAA
jgi:hypothetical protein